MWNNNTVEDEIQRNSLEYGVSVNTDRSIPDAKSGLKPVARRIIYDAFIEGRTSDKPHVKCARIYGDVMGRFHPHGDSSIYGAMIRLSQDWVMRYPLIDVHGNNGTILGDGPAAGRYTEARLSKIAEDGLLHGLKKRNVDFVPNYDESEEEPVTLPAIFPNLLCNPNEGIGWAMGCSWAPHNLNEVAAAIKDYLAGKEPMLPGPDFPTGGVIINKDDIPNIMRTGHGSVKVRGKYNIEGNNITFYEIPYGTRVEALMEEIGAACDEGKITGIADVRNETGKKGGLRLTIQVERGADAVHVVNQLFAKTDLQSSFSYNQVALIGKTPTELNLKDAIKVYINHNIDCICREAAFDLKKINDRLHIVDGLLKALEDIDNIIALIKKSESAAVAKTALINKYLFSEIQAKAILDMKLAKLASLEKIELQNEKTDLTIKADELTALLNQESFQKDELVSRLDIIVKKYGDARRTELIQISENPEDKAIELVTPEDVVVVLSKTGDIKRIPAKSFKVQNRKGKGIKSEDEAVIATLSTNTIDNLMLFSEQGKMFKMIVDNVPVGTNISKGARIGTLIKMDANDKIVAMTSFNRKSNYKYVCFFTKNGLFKKTLLEEYMSVKKTTGIAAIKLNDGDAIANVVFMNDEDVIVATKNGMAICFETKYVNPIGRVTAGVKSIKLGDGDEVIVGLPIFDKNCVFATFTEKGYAKKSNLDDYPIQGRAGKGVMNYSVTPVTGKVIAAALITNDNNILLTGIPNSICVTASDIPLINRGGTGNLMIKSSNVKSIAKF